MQQIIVGDGGDGIKELLIRKSKWLIMVIFFRIIFFLGLLLLLSYLIFNILENMPTDPYLRNIIGILLLIMIMYFFILSIIWIVRYYFDVVICSKDKILRIKLGLFYKDTIDMIELYRVQEMEIMMDGFLRILFNVGDIALIEQNDMKKIIHWIDRPKAVVLLIQDLKTHNIKNRHVK